MHVPFEGPGAIRNWIDDHGHQLKFTRFYEGESLPDPESVDLLIIMGGNMNVFDYHIHPWMQDEIDWVSNFIQTGKPILGICLGAQIIATALGSEVYPGKQKEIGWHNIRFLPCLGDYKICKNLPPTRRVFHWHGDTFDIPEGANRIAESHTFPNQGFIYERRVVALQFHLEVTSQVVEGLLQHAADDLTEGAFVQSVTEIKEGLEYCPENKLILFQLLDRFLDPEQKNNWT